MENTNNNMKNIKKILQNYEAPYDHKDWLRLKKDLPGASKSGGATKIILVSSVIVATIASIILFINSFDSDKKEITKIETPVVVKETESNIINQKIDEPIIVEQTIPEEPTPHYNYNSFTNTNNENTIKTKQPDTKILVDEDKTKTHINSEQTQAKQTKAENTYSEKTLITQNKDINNESETVDVNTNTDIDKISFSIEVLDNCVPAKVKFYAENCPKNYEILWNTGENTKISGNKIEYTYLKEGNYQPEVFVILDNFIMKSERLNDIVINKSTNIEINFDNSENSYYFTCDKIDDLDLVWTIENQHFNSKELSYRFDKEGVYMINLTGTNKFGCKSEVSKNIIIAKEQVFFVPNAFTPNSNDINSYFGPIGENLTFASYLLIVLDSNGVKVFESDKPEFMWNGKINNVGDDAKPGVYLWEIKTLDNLGNYQNKKGRVNLIRN